MLAIPPLHIHEKTFFKEFLFALGLIAVPVMVHLFNFRPFKRVYFSNVSLLKKVELQTTGSRQVKRYALLLCRSLAVAFLVLAFARPYMADQDNAAALNEEFISIYIDNSYSMEAVSREGSLLEEARRKAKEIVSTYGANIRVQLVTNDFEGLHQRLMSKEEFYDAEGLSAISTRASCQPLSSELNINVSRTAFLASIVTFDNAFCCPATCSLTDTCSTFLSELFFSRTTSCSGSPGLCRGDKNHKESIEILLNSAT